MDGERRLKSFASRRGRAAQCSFHRGLISTSPHHGRWSSCGTSAACSGQGSTFIYIHFTNYLLVVVAAFMFETT